MTEANYVHKTMRAARAWFLPLAVTAVLVGGLAVMTVGALGPRSDVASTAPQGGMMPVKATPGATLRIDRERAELGMMSVDETRSADFTLTNVGTAPVEISQVRTSCMCSFARVAIGGQKSPDFNMAMHNSPEVNSWKGVLEPGQTTVVTVIYQPSLMPVEGSVARHVKFATNDSQNPTVGLEVHATVKRGPSS